MCFVGLKPFHKWQLQRHQDHKPVFRQKVCDKPCLVLVGLWPVSQVAGNHPDHSDDDDDGDDDDDDDDDDDHDDDFDDDYLCLSARVMYQSKTAVSGKTCRPQKCFLTIILFLICFFLLTIILF